MTLPLPQASSADVALLLEGTFPYVSGGVSSWINQMIRAYPQTRFAIVFLGSRRSDYNGFKYGMSVPYAPPWKVDLLSALAMPRLLHWCSSCSTAF